MKYSWIVILGVLALGLVFAGCQKKAVESSADKTPPPAAASEDTTQPAPSAAPEETAAQPAKERTVSQPAAKTSTPTPKATATPKASAKIPGLVIKDMKVGTGATAKSGDIVTVHYTGWLTDGTKFDSSVDRGEPLEFPLGAGKVIEGWDKGVVGMKVGGKRKLTISPELGYRDQPTGPIPPNSTLIFDVELLGVK